MLPGSDCKACGYFRC
ncbi:(Fe-S)-binding protein [Phascolarctobacterium succinatutens]